jgi:hypothetical protein
MIALKEPTCDLAALFCDGRLHESVIVPGMSLIDVLFSRGNVVVTGENNGNAFG